MDVTIIGTGFIGSTLGRALASAGHVVTFGSRHPANEVVGWTGVVASIGDAVAASEVIILAMPGTAVAELAREVGSALAGKLVIDATNRMGEPVANSRSELPPTIRYARAFNTLGGENFENPVFPGGTADLFFSAPVADRAAVEEIVAAVGLGPVYVGEDQEGLIEALFKLWIELAMKQGRGRHLAMKLVCD